MPDLKLLLQALSLSLAIAFFLQLCVSRLTNRPTAKGFMSTVILAVAFFAGSVYLGGTPRVPPAEDRDRLLLVLVPFIVIVEGMSAWLPFTAKWLSRAAVAFATIPILLYGTPYLSESELARTVGSIGGLAVLLWLSAVHLGHLSQRAPRLVGYTFVLTSFAAGLTVLLSGYLSAGLMGFILGASLFGSSVASRLARDPSGQVFLPLVCIFGLSVVGGYFGTLPLWIGVTVFAAPNLLGIIELKTFGRIPAGGRKLLGIAAVTIPLAVAVMSCVRAFEKDSAPAAQRSEGSEPSASDYLNFGQPPSK